MQPPPSSSAPLAALTDVVSMPTPREQVVEAWRALLDLLPGPAFASVGSGARVVWSIAAHLAHPRRPPWVGAASADDELPIGVRRDRWHTGSGVVEVWRQDPALAEVSVHPMIVGDRWGLDPALARVAAGMLVGQSIGALTVRLDWTPDAVADAWREVLMRAGARDVYELRAALRDTMGWSSPG